MVATLRVVAPTDSLPGLLFYQREGRADHGGLWRSTGRGLAGPSQDTLLVTSPGHRDWSDSQQQVAHLSGLLGHSGSDEAQDKGGGPLLRALASGVRMGHKKPLPASLGKLSAGSPILPLLWHGVAGMGRLNKVDTGLSSMGG